MTSFKTKYTVYSTQHLIQTLVLWFDQRSREIELLWCHLSLIEKNPLRSFSSLIPLYSSLSEWLWVKALLATQFLSFLDRIRGPSDTMISSKHVRRNQDSNRLTLLFLPKDNDTREIQLSIHHLFIRFSNGLLAWRSNGFLK